MIYTKQLKTQNVRIKNRTCNAWMSFPPTTLSVQRLEMLTIICAWQHSVQIYMKLPWRIVPQKYFAANTIINIKQRSYADRLFFFIFFILFSYFISQKYEFNEKNVTVWTRKVRANTHNDGLLLHPKHWWLKEKKKTLD